MRRRLSLMPAAAVALLLLAGAGASTSGTRGVAALGPAPTKPALVQARMRAFNAGLGVACDFCHAGTDYASDAVDMKAVARRMMRMTDAMNQIYFDGRAEISCYTCHRGQKQPMRQPPAPGGR